MPLQLVPGQVSRIIQLFTEYPFGVACRLRLSHLLHSRITCVIPDRYLLVPYVGGKIYLNLKESSMMMDRAFGVYEYWKTYIFRNMVKPGMTIVDVGVNKGYYSLLAAKLLNGSGAVLSFEPDPENCYWIRSSISANRYTIIRLFQIALSDTNGTADFYLGKKSGWGSFCYSPSASISEIEKIRVETRKLDDVLLNEGIDAIDVIKRCPRGRHFGA